MRNFFCLTLTLMSKHPKNYFHFSSIPGNSSSFLQGLKEVSWVSEEGTESKIKVRLSQDIPGFISQTLKQQLGKEWSNFYSTFNKKLCKLFLAHFKLFKWHSWTTEKDAKNNMKIFQKYGGLWS